MELRDLIRRLGEEGRTILLSTHNLTEAEELCRRVAVIRGRLLAVDTPERLRQRFFRKQLVVQLASADGRVTEAVRKLPFVQEAKEQGTGLIIDLTDSDRFRPDLVEAIVRAGGRVLTVTEEQHPLEETYLKLVHEGQGNDK